MHKHRPTDLGFRPASKRRLADIAALFLFVNHVYTTETLGKLLGKEQRTPCKGFTNKNFKYTLVPWDRCQAKSGKLMSVANHTIIDGDPMVCGYLTAQKNITKTKDFLAGLMVECHPLVLQSS